MAWNRVDYADVRDRIRPGDLIAFGGTSPTCELIKRVTESSVSHVGVVLHPEWWTEGPSWPEICDRFMEATPRGMKIAHLGRRVKRYDGTLWWLPLSDAARQQMDLEAFHSFLHEQKDKPYDVAQAIKSGLDMLDANPLLRRMTYNVEDLSSLFCSELVAAALEACGVIGRLNASEVTPIDLCRFAIYRSDYYQLKGENAQIQGYNTLSPEGWGE